MVLTSQHSAYVAPSLGPQQHELLASLRVLDRQEAREQRADRQEHDHTGNDREAFQSGWLSARPAGRGRHESGQGSFATKRGDGVIARQGLSGYARSHRESR